MRPRHLQLVSAEPRRPQVTPVRVPESVKRRVDADLQRRIDAENDDNDPTSVFYNAMDHWPFRKCPCPTCNAGYRIV
jgi:hypothetical protein